MTGLCLGFTNSEGTWGKCDTCLCLGCGGVGGVGREWAVGQGQGLGGWSGAMSVCAEIWIHCVDGRPSYLYIVQGGYLRILGAPSVQSCCTVSISAS